MIWTVLAVAVLGAGDASRLDIVRAQLAADSEQALVLAERELERSPADGHARGLSYLRGDLLERLGRPRDAHAAFAEALANTPALRAHSRFRLALNQSRRGHPEVAAGLLATLLANDAPQSLVAPAARLLFESLEKGGDCRLVRGAKDWPLDPRLGRLLQVSTGACTGKSPNALSRSQFLTLLADDVRDEAARLAADHLAETLGSADADVEELLLIGQAFQHQRRFDVAAGFLTRGLSQPAVDMNARSLYLAGRYALARSYFWLEHYLDAASEFGRLAAESKLPEDSARALYQQGRSFELDGAWEAAVSSFQMAFLEDPDGRWADAALLSTLRLQWHHGDEDEAMRLYSVLGSRREWSDLYGRAALFLASSDIVRRRTDRADLWLSQARRASRELGALTSYWLGRLAELTGETEKAVDAYLEALISHPSEPLSGFARARLANPELEPARAALAARLRTLHDTKSRYRAWLLLAESERQPLAELLRRSYAQAASQFFDVRFIDPAEWRLWETLPRSPDDLLLRLGMWAEGSAAIRRHFPPTNVALGYTGSRLLARGGAEREALRVAETLVEGARALVPAPFVPVPLRRAAYPVVFGSTVALEARQHDIDPYLLTALIREESRFDPHALSPAAARGLTQVVLPTARRLEERAGLRDLTAEDLHDPAISIKLGAVYLSELYARFSGRLIRVVAAYNAGERQAELWQSYCFSVEPDEYFTKVGFPETRDYVARVLTSRAEYVDLYPEETFSAQSPPSPSDPITTDGSSVSSASK